MTKVTPRRILADRESCEKAFDVELDYTGMAEGMEYLTYHAIRGQDDFVKLPTWLAAGAVLALKGILKRSPHRQRKSWQQKRDEILDRARDKTRGDDPMIVWARDRMKEIRRDAKAAGKPIKADVARLQAAKEAKTKFGSPRSAEQIADRMRRPGIFARSQTQPR